MKKKGILVTLASTALALALGACGGLAGLEKTDYTVELGERFSLPKVDGATITLVDGSGQTVKHQFGAFLPKLGEYVATYDVDGKTAQVKVKCVDTTAPTIEFSEFSQNVVVGDEVTLPAYVAADNGAIVEQKVTVTKRDGAEVLSVTAGMGETIDFAEKKWTAENDSYAVKVSVKDASGNSTEKTVGVSALSEFVDSNLESNVLFDFDEPEYFNLVWATDSSQEQLRATVLTSGYPTLDGDDEANGVLELSSDATYDYVYAKLVNYASIKAGAAQKIVFKIAADRDTDFVEVINGKTGATAAVKYLLKKGEWYELEVLPIKFGTGYDFSDVVIKTRANNGVKLYIDEISYVPAWIDKDLTEDQLAVFNKQEYVGKMQQNVYNGHAWVAGGSKFELAEYNGYQYARDPETGANGAKTAYTCTAMKVTTYTDLAGFSFMFDEPVDVSEISEIVIRMTVIGNPRHLWVGAFNGACKGGSYNAIAGWEAQGWNHLNAAGAQGMTDYHLPNVKTISTDGKISGIWISVIDGDETGCEMYIESITLQR